MKTFIKVVVSEYIKSDGDADNFLECFKEVYIFGILVYQKILNSMNKEKISKFMSLKRKAIGFDLNEENNENKM